MQNCLRKYVIVSLIFIMLVSTANKIGIDGPAIIFGRSFIEIMKNKGPRIEP
jgi:hypothetical protein